MNNERVTLHIDNGIAFVTLNRADKHNALDMAMFKAIDKISRQLKQNRDIRAVIVQANGEDFCSGVEGMLPVKTFEVFLNEQGNMRWRGMENGKEVVLTKEPQTGFWRRMNGRFMRLLPIRDQL